MSLVLSNLLLRGSVTKEWPKLGKLVSLFSKKALILGSEMVPASASQAWHSPYLWPLPPWMAQPLSLL